MLLDCAASIFNPSDSFQSSDDQETDSQRAGSSRARTPEKESACAGPRFRASTDASASLVRQRSEELVLTSLGA